MRTLSDDEPITAGIVINDAANGKFTVSNAEFKTTTPGTYQYSLVRTRPDGTKELVWRGTICAPPAKMKATTIK